MKRARVPVVGVVAVGVAAWVGACSSSSGVNLDLDGGGDRKAQAEGGLDVLEEMFGSDQGQDVPPVDSHTDSATDSPIDQTSEEGFDVTPLDGPLPEATTDAPSDVVDEFIDDSPTEDFFFFDGGDGSTEDDSGFCALPDAETSVFPATCTSCLEEGCCAQLTACDSNAGCKSIADCIGQCLIKGESNCEITCYDSGDAGKALASELLDCINEECGSSTEDDCN
jgi:hypothetical protein